MTYTKIFCLSAFILVLTGTYYEATAQPHLYANYISANNIGAMQRSIMTNTMQTFEGSIAAAITGQAVFYQDFPQKNKKEAAANLYGRQAMYGTLSLYGEYGDDGSVFSDSRGRNGGDEYDSRPTLNNMWANWNHFDGKAKFKDYDVLNSDYDLLTFGFAGGESQKGIGISEWGFFGGYSGGVQENDFLNLSEHGGFIGFYSGYNIQKFNLSFAINIGSLSNTAESLYGVDKYTNMWSGAALNATYNINIDDTFTLQPGLYAGYTWVGSGNYISISGENVANKNLNMFEITPALRAIKHITRGWFGYIGVKYVFRDVNGGDIFIDGDGYEMLDIANYSEYGIGLEKSVDRFNISFHLNRLDGGYYGWDGGFNLKYIF